MTPCTEAAMLSLVDATFPSPTYAVLRHVRNGTGWLRAARTIDALVVGCWPSRGLVLWAVEVKVTRADFRRELKEAEKADALARYCDAFYIAAPKGIVPVDELPPAWGLYEADGGKKLSRAKEATTNATPKALDRLFLAAICRAATTGVVPKGALDELVEQRLAQAREHLEKQADAAQQAVVNVFDHEALQRDHDRLKAAVQAFESASGVRFDDWNGRRIGQAVVDALSVDDSEQVAKRYDAWAQQAARCADQMRAHATLIRSEKAADATSTGKETP